MLARLKHFHQNKPMAPLQGILHYARLNMQTHKTLSALTLKPHARNITQLGPNTMHLNKNAKTYGFTLIIQRHGNNGSRFCFPLSWKDQSKDYPRLLTLKPHTNAHAKLDPNPWEK